MLFIGPPGSGKSMLAKRIPTIIPPMSLEEAVGTTKIHSICGLLSEKNAFVSHRPFRSPHHTISDIGLLGGSANPTPGEVSIAHNGVLFLDELPEFKRSTLEVLRQPLERGFDFQYFVETRRLLPSKVFLAAAMLPCACGYFRDSARECRCTPAQVAAYRSRVPTPFLDLIDIQVAAPAANYRELSSTEAGEPSAAIRERVVRAQARQKERFGEKPMLNAKMSRSQIQEFCGGGASDIVLKISRTIADIAGEENIKAEHIAEANQYRELERKL